MGFSITGGESSWVGVIFFLLAIPAVLIFVVWLLSAGKQAHDEVVEEDRDAGRDGPLG